MKRTIILFAAILMACSVSFAQSKGDMYVSGGLTLGVGAGSQKVSIEGKSTTTSFPASADFSLTPTFGYFIADNLRLGASFTFDYGTDSGSKTSNFLIGPEVAYYVRLADKFYYTPEVGLYGGVAIVANDIRDASMGAFAMGFKLAQFEFRPTPKLGFAVNVVGFQYKHMSEKVEKTKFAINSFDFDIDASLAVRYYF